MPAWRGRLSPGRGRSARRLREGRLRLRPRPDAVAAGRDAAARLGCFACHGPQGRFDTPNPGSLKGYVPAWSGADFPELARDEGEIREWIRDGSPKRLRDNPVAAFFIRRQAIRMPAFGDRVSADEVRKITAYIVWLRGGAFPRPLSATIPRAKPRRGRPPALRASSPLDGPFSAPGRRAHEGVEADESHVCVSSRAVEPITRDESMDGLARHAGVDLHQAGAWPRKLAVATASPCPDWSRRGSAAPPCPCRRRGWPESRAGHTEPNRAATTGMPRSSPATGSGR